MSYMCLNCDEKMTTRKCATCEGDGEEQNTRSLSPQDYIFATKKHEGEDETLFSICERAYFEREGFLDDSGLGPKGLADMGFTECMESVYEFEEEEELGADEGVRRLEAAGLVRDPTFQKFINDHD